MNKQAVARTFSKAASSYDGAAHLQRRVADRLLSEVSTLPIDANPTLADLGTGTGYCLAPLEQRFVPGRLHALDLSAAMLAQAQQKCPTCSPCLADLESLPFADNSHDLLVSSLAVQWLNAPQPFLAEARRVLKPGGFLALTTLGPQTLAELRQAWGKVDDSPHVNRFPPFTDWREAAEQTCLLPTHWQEEQIQLTYPEPLKLLQELKSLGASHVEGRTGRPGRSAVKQMIEGYRQFRLEDGSYPANWQVLYLVLRKSLN